MTDDTARWVLPLLAAGQAQKEMTVNEALARVDLLLQASVAAIGLDTPPAAPVPGDVWVVGDAPTGAWAGQANALAGYTADGWRFVGPREGLSVWSEADGVAALFAGGGWRTGQVTARALVVAGVQVVGVQQPAIAAPAGGTVTDAEARGTLDEVLAAMRAHGLIAG